MRGVAAALAALAVAAWARAAGPAAPRTPYWLGPVPSAPVRRIVTVAPSVTDVLVALGAGPKIVGVTRYDDNPAVAGARRVGGYVDPDLETILGLRPDLVVAEPSPGNQGVMRKLAALGVPVRIVHGASLAEVRTQIRVLGDDLGRPEAAEALLRTLDARLRAVRTALAGTEPTSAVILVGLHPLIAAGPGSLADEILSLAGGRNVVEAGASPYPTLPLEVLLTRPPDIVFDFSGTPAGERPAALARLSGQWVTFPDSRLLRPGPDIARSVATLAHLLHPDRVPKPRSPRDTPRRRVGHPPGAEAP